MGGKSVARVGKHYNKINLHLFDGVDGQSGSGPALLASNELLEPKSGNYSFYEPWLSERGDISQGKHVNHKN